MVGRSTGTLAPCGLCRNFQLNRERCFEERILHRILRKPFFGRFEVPWVWPDGEYQNSWEHVSFRNPSGASITGLWGAAHGEAIGTLVLAHPMGKAAKRFWLKQDPTIGH